MAVKRTIMLNAGSDVNGKLLNGYSVKTMLYNTPIPPSFIVLTSSGETLEVKAIKFHEKWNASFTSV